MAIRRRRGPDEEPLFIFLNILPIRKRGPLEGSFKVGAERSGVEMKTYGVAAAAARMCLALSFAVLCVSCSGTGEGSTLKTVGETRWGADGQAGDGTASHGDAGREAGWSQVRKEVQEVPRSGLTFEEREVLRNRIRRSRPSLEQMAEIRRRNAERRAETLNQEADQSTQYAMGTSNPSTEARRDF
jgi:hypothetical protein